MLFKKLIQVSLKLKAYLDQIFKEHYRVRTFSHDKSRANCVGFLCVMGEIGDVGEGTAARTADAINRVPTLSRDKSRAGFAGFLGNKDEPESLSPTHSHTANRHKYTKESI